MLNNTISEIVFFNTRSRCHEGRAYRGITSTVNSGKTVRVVCSIPFCNIENNIPAFRSTFTNKRSISVAQS